jgi:hypothetical protein
MATRMQQRRGTQAQWTAANPVLAAGEIGFEVDTNKFKVGDGTNTWSSRPYFVDASIVFDSDEVQGLINTAVNGLVDGAPNALNTLNEIAAALNDDASLYTTLTNVITQGLDSVSNNLSVHADTQDNVHGIADFTVLTTQTYVANAIDTHDQTTSNVHGIANTYALATTNGVTSEISTHNTETASVHGISNTLALVYTNDSRLSDERTPSSSSVTASKIASDAVETGKIVNAAVTAEKLANNSVETAKIANGAVTDEKIANNIAQSHISNLVEDLGNKQDKVAGVSDAEIGYLDGVTSNVQAQIDGKASLSGAIFTGSVEIDQDLTVDGNFIVNGSNVLVSATQIQIEDTLLQLGHTNAANATDLGLVTSYNDGTQKHSGLVKDVTDGKWKLFDGVITEPATTVDFTEGTLDTLALKFLEANTVTVSDGVTFSDGTQTKEGVPSRTPIISKTDSYTLSALTERDSLIEVNKANAVTITIPTNSSVAFPIGTSLDILQTGAGQVTIAGDGGVTVNATPGLKLRTQYSSVTLFKRAENTWVAFGDLTA